MSSQSTLKHLIVCILFISLLMTSPAYSQMTPAEKLAAQAPKDSLFFIASSGLDHIKPAFDQSALSKIWNDAVVQQYVKQFQEQLTTVIGSNAEIMQAKMGFSIFKQVARHPFIIGMTEATGKMPLSMFAVIDAGDNVEQFKLLTDQLTGLIMGMAKDQITEKRIGSSTLYYIDDDEMPACFGWHKNYFFFITNDPRASILEGFRPGGYISRRLSPFKAMEANGDAVAMMVNWNKIHNLIAKNLEPDQKEMFQNITDAIGLNSIDTIKFRAGFSDSDVILEMLASTTGSPVGLFECLGPIDISQLDLIDSNVTSVEQVNINLAKLYDSIFKIIKSVAPPDKMIQVEGAIAAYEQMLQIKIRDDLLASLKGPVISMQFPPASVSGQLKGSSVVIAELSDSAKFQKSLMTLEQFAKQMAKGNLQINSSTRPDGVVIHNWVNPTLAMLQVVPSWSIVDNNWIFAPDQKAVENIINKMKSPGEKSIRSLPAFQQMEAKLPQNVYFLHYEDTEKQFKGLMTLMKQAWPMATMGAKNAGINLPVEFPDLNHLADHLSPSWQYLSKDSSGYRVKINGMGILSSQVAVGTGAMGLAILMPALNTTKKIAQRVVSGTNLKGLGTAAHVYANDNNGKFPDNLQIFLDELDMSPKTLTNPRAADNDKAGYILVPGLTASMDPDTIYIYENPEVATDGKINVLYVDGRAVCISMELFRQQMRNK